jgi:hypothetical protein
MCKMRCSLLQLQAEGTRSWRLANSLTTARRALWSERTAFLLQRSDPVNPAPCRDAPCSLLVQLPLQQRGLLSGGRWWR